MLLIMYAHSPEIKRVKKKLSKTLIVRSLYNAAMGPEELPTDDTKCNRMDIVSSRIPTNFVDDNFPCRLPVHHPTYPYIKHTG